MSPLRRKPVLTGMIVIALGVVWLVNNLGLVQVGIGRLIATYWPALLIVWGIDVIISGCCREEGRPHFDAGVVNGLLLLVLGAVILGGNLGYYHINLRAFWRILWPIMLILLGWGILRGAVSTGRTHWAVMSGLDLKSKGWKLEDGSYLALMGGAKIDLSVANIPLRETVLNLTAVMGGIEVLVPPGLTVECEGIAVLGGINFFREEAGGIVVRRRAERPGGADQAVRVKILCRAVMGGIEVKET